MNLDIKAFIFDLDGVITDTAELHFMAWKKMADEEGFNFDRNINELLRGVSRRASLEIILNGIKLPEEKVVELMKRKNMYYMSLIQSITEDDILPGINELLKELNVRDIKIALASASKNAIPILKKLGLMGQFDAISDGSSVCRTKPEPDVFVHACGQLNLKAKNCLVVEDAAAGVKGAKSCGMKTIGIGPISRVGEADYIYLEPKDINLEHIFK